ncbi:hypothetical protein BU17DRAFT_67504 [Hysterangium stoloniferum]|nr:hypothetical protein BU17DRAFT_67504 [Hysterangium stoloniferum]
MTNFDAGNYPSLFARQQGFAAAYRKLITLQSQASHSLMCTNEIRLVWPATWSLGKILYFIISYILIVNVFLLTEVGTAILSPSACLQIYKASVCEETDATSSMDFRLDVFFAIKYSPYLPRLQPLLRLNNWDIASSLKESATVSMYPSFKWLFLNSTKQLWLSVSIAVFLIISPYSDRVGENLIVSVDFFSVLMQGMFYSLITKRMLLNLRKAAYPDKSTDSSIDGVGEWSTAVLGVEAWLSESNAGGGTP